MLKKLSLLFFVFSGIALNALVLEQKDINANGRVILVASFNDKTKIDEAISKLPSNYNLYVQRFKDKYLLKIVNIESFCDLKEKLKVTKKSFSDAWYCRKLSVSQDEQIPKSVNVGKTNSKNSVLNTSYDLNSTKNKENKSNTLALIVESNTTSQENVISKEEDKLSVFKRNGVIRFGVKQDFKPFGFLDDKNQTVGFDIDIAKYIAEKLKLKYELKGVLSKERLQVLQQNSVDIVIASMTINEARAKVIDFSKPYFFETQAMLVKKNAKEKTYRDFEAKYVGAVQGATSGVNLSKLAPRIKIAYFQGYKQALHGVRTDLVEAITTDYSWCMSQVEDNPKDFKVLGEAISFEPYGVGVAKNQKALLDKINKILTDCVKDGTYSKIYKKWFNKKPAKLP